MAEIGIDYNDPVGLDEGVDWSDEIRQVARNRAPIFTDTHPNMQYAPEKVETHDTWWVVPVVCFALAIMVLVIFK